MSERYRQLSPSEFFYRNREIAGFSNPVRAVYQTIRELVENSLDATEMHGLLPEIKIEVRDEGEEKVTISVEDNGVGISPLEVPNVFGRVFYGSKYVLRQSRGVFGLGVKMAVLYAQMTTGQPVKVRTATRRSKFVYEYQVAINIEKNMPTIKSLAIMKNEDGWHGTRVELSMKGNWIQAKKRVEEYIRRTAIIAPYATIIVDAPDFSFRFERSSTKLPPTPITGKPHPHGVDIELLKKIIEGSKKTTYLFDFLIKNFDGVGPATAKKFFDTFGLNPDLKVKDLKIDEIEDLANKMQVFDDWRRPKHTTLSPLGEELLVKGVKAVLNPSFVTAVSRPPSSYAGHPFIVEVALAYGGSISPMDEPMLLRFANRIPLLYDEGVDVSTKVLGKIDWKTYKIDFPSPLAVVTHVCSTKVPFKGVGKEAVADVPEVESEIESGLRECARRLRTHLSRLERLFEVKRWEITVSKYVDEVSSSLSYVTGVDHGLLQSKLLALIKARVMAGDRNDE
ncbi:MAG: DNA topoisomerase VI subunit B [Thermofilaceae archaeon]|nr:DNA topoisomerase VI subunit B [Thermofilaceae archaeon]MDW8004510.1 DNA topoisomerase VI subunit B [Thermofilaceae archaeon]